jgi:ribonuclease III
LVDVSLLEQRLGIVFKDRTLLDLSLIHSSYINENSGIVPTSNERLEFLGDAILGLVTAQKLYQDFPESDEGELTRLRSALVRRETLAQIAGLINLGDYLRLGVGEEAGGGRQKPANLARALESLIAAIYLDGGLELARESILKLFGPEIWEQAQEGAGTDYKSKLQEIIQAGQQVTPDYQLIKATGPDHARQFTVEVKAGNTVLGQGTGKSKKAAEMDAARVALKKMK